MGATTETAPASPRREPRSGIRRVWRELRLLDALMLSGVPLLALLLLVGDGVVRAERYAQFRDWWTELASVRTFVGDRVHALATLPERVALRQRFDPDAADAGIIRIDVPRESWDAMQGDPQAMWGEWVDVVLTYGGTSLDARIRKRGDNSVHWLTDKRSFTVRTSRDEFYKDYREFGLSVKDVLSSFLANRLASEFDLLVPATAVVPVYLNNQFYGMFRFLEVVDEGFLRRAGRMPGNVYRGDTAERGEAFKSVPRNLFVNPYIWDRVAVNDRWTAAPPDQLQRMLEDLRGGTFEAHQRLMARFDRDEYARLFAYFMVVGDPFHSTGVHNQFLYEDPSTQRLHPIPWDIRLRDVTVRGAEFNDLFRELLRDPWLTDRVMQVVARTVEDGRIGPVARALVEEADTRYHDYFEYDRLRAGLVPDVGSADQAAALVEGNLRTLGRWIEDDTVAVAVNPAGPFSIVDVETRGRVGVDLVAIDGIGTTGAPRLYRDRNLNGTWDPDDPEVPTRREGSRLVLESPLPLLAAWETSLAGFDPGRMAYRLFLRGAIGAAPELQLANRLTGATPAIEPLAASQPLAAPTGWHPWRYPAPTGTVHRFSGTVHLTETLRIPATDEVVVEPGTTFRLDPDVSVVSAGRVRLEGTEARPIRVVPAVPGKPWGTFSLQGPGASGSVVRHAAFVEGGGALVDRIEYIGMVNVHRARDVLFDAVRFEHNLRSDDTFHVLHGEVTLINSRFVEANSDAVDFDISTGEIRDNVFEGSGGDAIDLMTSTPRIIGNLIRRAGDKGISVGEDSSPVIFANVIEDSSIGIQVKDASTPVVLNNEIRRSGVGIGSHLKNWRYGGSGFGFVANTRLEANATPLDADALSRLTAIGVRGLDAGDEAAPPASLSWLYRRLGLAVDAPTVGLPGGWRAGAPQPPVAELRFADDFGDVADGWTGSSRVTRLEKRDGVLVVEAEGGAGGVTRDVDWDLTTAGGGVLVVELAGRDIQAVRVEVEGDRGRLTQDATVSADPARFSLVELPLAGDHYRRVTVVLEPTPGLSHIQRTTGLSVIRAGRLTVRSVAVYPAAGGPAGGEGSR